MRQVVTVILLVQLTRGQEYPNCGSCRRNGECDVCSIIVYYNVRQMSSEYHNHHYLILQ